MNQLYYGDCLTIMREFMAPESVDLVYLDPPFNSNRAYNAIYKDETGRPLPDQIEAFCDLWSLDGERERAIRDMPVLVQEAGIGNGLAEFWRVWPDALRKSQPRLLAYLSYMTERLLFLRNILKPTGSIYLHCDPTASHYIKLMMDGVFGHENFQNEIVWYYKNASRGKRRLAKSHDVIFWYSKSDKYVFNRDDILVPFESGMTDWRYEQGGQKGKEKPKGKTPDDVFMLPSLNTMAKERLGYATQKPLALLDWIIKASSNAGDVVLDPFCGCATTLEAAHRLQRNWVGIDIAIHAIKRVAKVRLEDRLGLKEGRDFAVNGVPRSLEGAQALWRQDAHHFQKWAVEQVEGFVTMRRSGDGGIDGRLYFDLGGARLESMILEVKGGANVGIGVVRDLRGSMEREGVPMAGLILLEELGERKGENFRREMAAAGELEHLGKRYARMQMLTVREILEGKRFATPSVARGRGEGAPKLPMG